MMNNDNDTNVPAISASAEAATTGHHGASRRSVIDRLGGADVVMKAVENFYEAMFVDEMLRHYVAETSPVHAERLGKFIIERLGGDALYTALRGHGFHTLHKAHDEAMLNKHRVTKEPRQHRFSVDDARRWMHLMFLSCRKLGVGVGDDDAWQKFVSFISFAMGIYVPDARRFAASEAMAASMEARSVVQTETPSSE